MRIYWISGECPWWCYHLWIGESAQSELINWLIRQWWSEQYLPTFVQCIFLLVCSVFLYLWAVYLYESPSTSWSWSDDRRRPPEFIRFRCIQLWDSVASNIYLLGSDVSNKSGVPILMHQLSLEPVGSIILQIQIPSSLNFRNCQSHNFDSSHHQASSRRGNWEMAIWCEDWFDIWGGVTWEGAKEGCQGNSLTLQGKKSKGTAPVSEFGSHPCRRSGCPCRPPNMLCNTVYVSARYLWSAGTRTLHNTLQMCRHAQTKYKIQSRRYKISETKYKLQNTNYKAFRRCASTCLLSQGIFWKASGSHHIQLIA